MNIYDKTIEECLKLLEGKSVKKLSYSENSSKWKESTEQKLILKKETAYELGGGKLSAVSGLAFSSDKQIKDEILLYGPDLSEIEEDIPYARLTILNVDDSKWKNNDEAYAIMRRIDYTRYHVYPEGFMMRISTSADREQVRIGRSELCDGLNFEKVGAAFINAYHKHTEVKGAKIIFITDKNFEYSKLLEKIIFMEKITESLNKIYSNITMDCNTCGLKNICDEVEGLKKLHFEL